MERDADHAQGEKDFDQLVPLLILDDDAVYASFVRQFFDSVEEHVAANLILIYVYSLRPFLSSTCSLGTEESSHRSGTQAHQAQHQ